MPPRLLRAYRATRYQVGGVTVHVGRRSVAMDALLSGMGARSGGFITAWNPLSRRLPEGWNHRMQRCLEDHLRHLARVPATGSLRRWREAHVLAAAHPRQLLRLARRFRQRGVVVVRRRQPARLMLLNWGG